MHGLEAGTIKDPPHHEPPLRGDLPLTSSLRASFAPVPAKQGMAIYLESVTTSLLCACAREEGYGDLPLDSIIWKHHGQFACSARMPA